MKTIKLLFFLGWRNVIRYRKRTIQTFLVLFLGTLSIMIVDSFMQGYRESSVRRIVLEEGHLDIHGRGYLESAGGMPLDKTVRDLGALSAKMSSASEPVLIPGTSMILAPCIETGCLVSDGNASRAAMVLATDFVSASSDGVLCANPLLENVSNSLIEGRFPESGDRSVAIIDEKIASKLNIETGDEVILSGSDAFGSFSMTSAVVIGIVHKDSLPGGFGCVTDIAAFAPAFGLDDQCTKLIGWVCGPDGSVLPSGSAGEAVFSAMQNAIGTDERYEARPFPEISAGYDAMFDFLNFFLSGMLGVFAIVAIVGITNAILLSVQDRVRDLGTLRAIAVTSGHASALIYIETLITGCLASACAFAVGALTIGILVKTGIGIRFELSDIGSALPDMLKPAFYPLRTVSFAVFSAVFPLAAAVLPARRAGKLTIRECLAS